MLKAISHYFGQVDYESGTPFLFPGGLPGFPDETSFLPIEVPEQLPLVYLQSLRSPDLCFVAVPVNCLLPDYRLELSSEEIRSLDLAPGAPPDTLNLALLCFGEEGSAAANLRAPIVINVKSRLGLQAIQTEESYSIRHSLSSLLEPPPC